MNLCLQQSISEIVTETDVRSCIKSKTLSKKFIKKLLCASILNIMHRRISIEDSEFVPEMYKNIPYVTVKRKSKNRLIRKYHDIMNAIIDSFDKSYLSHIYMFMRELDTDNVYETYTFSLKYNRSEKQKRKTSITVVKDAFITFFTAIQTLGEEKKLDEANVRLVFELRYFEDTPEQYEPPGFTPTSEPICLSLPEAHLILGSVNTGFHKVTCRAAGEIFAGLSRSATPAPPALSEDVEENLETQITEDIIDVESVTTHEFIEYEQEVKDEEELDKPKKKKMRFDGITVSDVPDDSYLLDLDNFSVTTLSCPCKLTSLKEFDSATCMKCGGLFHVICRGYLEADYINKEEAVCPNCETPNASSNDLTMTSLYRLVIHTMKKSNMFPSTIMKLIPVKERDFILKKLKNDGIYVKNGEKMGVDPDKLQEAVDSFFYDINTQYFS